LANNHRYEIRIAGFGGQGVVTIGRILGTAFSVYEKKNSVNTQSYGPESRGGACKSEVVVSDGVINYPYVRNADVLIALSQVALDTYLDNLKKGGILVVDPSSVRTVPNPDKYKVYRVPTIEIANGLGNVKYQNAVALGTLSALIPKLIAGSSICRALEENVPSQTRQANLSAYEKGMSYIAENYAETG
jgi:2-oxoglutarate ferredoxin oxidoreductase subunit gamma